MNEEQSLIHVGITESVSLPDYSINDVIAKIDTGADSSAIWASNITERNGELSFSLFGLGSTYYNGESIKTKRYSLVTIKNSFGHKEVRYRVYIKVLIANRLINAKVTLADRSNNKFPILIGRRTLRGKFLVNVSKKVLL